MSYHLTMDARWEEVTRLLAVGIALEEGHTMSCIRKPYQPGPNTMRIAREMLEEANQYHEGDERDHLLARDSNEWRSATKRASSQVEHD